MNESLRTSEEIIAACRKYHPNEDMSVIQRAYDFAKRAHEGQRRMSGEPYFTHPCEVAMILASKIGRAHV